ncbi:MAG: transferrin-binding protein-like solute binding protein [Alphaproteobacteria bacterium]|nr:transferrin-binding protein-like solute binding protein [Alphaproteobacteria bacterium]
MMRQLPLLFIILLSLALSACSDGSNGAKGARGAAGTNGSDGVNGINGANGIDGINGADGTDGINGADGTDGIDGNTFTNTEYTHNVRALNLIATGNQTPDDPVIPNAPNNVPYSSFTQLADAAIAEDIDAIDDIKLQGLAVMLNDTTIYKRTDNSIDWDNGGNPNGLKIHNQTQLSRIMSPTFTSVNAPAVALQFDNLGEMSVINAYGDKEYMASDATVTITIGDIFSFNSNYMAHITWHEMGSADFTIDTPIATDINGIMVAGFESNIADFPTTTADVTFSGAGKGIYRVFGADSLATDYNTSFTATATANFANHTLDFTTTNTKRTDNNETLTKLDLTANALDFSNGKNYLSTDILAGSLYGKLDARFYGTDAWEFGGTFALNDADSYYYGAFGGLRAGIDLSQAREFYAHIDTPRAVTLAQAETDAIAANPYTTFWDALMGYQTNPTITMNALGVYSDIRTDYTRSSNISNLDAGDKNTSNHIVRLSNAAVSRTVALINPSVFGITDVTLYLDNGTYTMTNLTNTSYQSLSGNIATGAPADATTAILRFYAGGSNALFSFTANSFAYIDWTITRTNTVLNDANTNPNLIDADYDIKGMMIAGMESGINNATTLLDNGKAIFVGGGRGHINDNQGNRTTRHFNVNANVDFGKYNVALASTDTCKANLNSSRLCAAESNQEYELNFTVDLSYAAGENIISGQIKTIGANTSYEGIADARFYGEFSKELAGTFAMSDADNYHYYGVFGSEIDDGDYIISETMRGTNVANVPTDINQLELTSFNDRRPPAAPVNWPGATDIALPVSSIAQIIRNDDDETVMNEKISGAVVEFDYDQANLSTDPDYEHFRDINLELFFDDKKYEVTAGTGIENSITGTTIDAGSADNPTNFNLNTDLFGFTANYMASLYWHVSKTNIKTYGYGITGYATKDNNLPNTTNPTFNGKGQGEYHYKYSKLSGNVSVRYFDVIANVDFSTRKVSLASQNTCSDSSDCENTQTADLNFSGTLSYEAGKNELTGTFSTAGDADTEPMIGTADARFYGTGSDKATELGGTFSLRNYEAGYVGYFGAVKQ